jgi:hypothetical protein
MGNNSGQLIGSDVGKPYPVQDSRNIGGIPSRVDFEGVRRAVKLSVSENYGQRRRCANGGYCYYFSQLREYCLLSL